MIDTNFNAANPNPWNALQNNFPMGNPAALLGNNNMFGNNTSSTSPDFRNALLELRRSADILAQSLNFMRGIGRENTNSPFSSLQAVSDNTDRMEILAGSNRLRDNNQSDFTVDVLQLARAQRNEGTSLNSSALASSAGFSVGANHIAINVGDRQFDIRFNVSATDTVRNVQDRIASAINTRNIGVDATVSVDSAAGRSSLLLQSSETGLAREGQPNFTVRNISGNAASVTGINSITQQAQNAQFRVNRGFNGHTQTSRSNDVNLGFGVNARLNETGSVNVTTGRDETGQINAFRHMVNSFNGLMEAAREVGRGSRMERELNQISRSSSAALNRIGISIDSEGFMDIDEERMREAAERGDLERFASRDNVGGRQGFTNRLTGLADSAARNPGAYMNVDESLTPFGNSGLSFNPRQMAQMNQLMNMGMLFETHI